MSLPTITNAARNRYHIKPCTMTDNKAQKLVTKHISTNYKKPISNNHKEIAIELENLVCNKPFIWDFGCGTGKSSIMLAATHPNHLIIGVDKSGHRLAQNSIYNNNKTITLKDNLILVRANLIDLIYCWQGSVAEQQFWLHPNPWPKAKHAMRRLPFHPIFPKALSMAKISILHTNWLSYAQNWQLAANMQDKGCELSTYRGLAMSAFEQKYIANNIKIYQVIC